MYFLPETRVTPLIALKRERILSVRGEVLVPVGEWVEAVDLVAHADLPRQRQVVDIAGSLDVPAGDLEPLLRKQLGDYVEANEVLAMRRGPLGLTRKTCRAPVEGTITALQGGMALLETEPQPLELRAHLRGQVVSVMPDRGVVISTVGAWIQGVWGNDKEANGVLKVLVDDPAQPLRAQFLDADCRGVVAVAGSGSEERALRVAEEYEVRGLVLGSLDAALCDLVKELSFPVMVTEGMGRVPMSSPMFELLTRRQGREASLSTATQTRWGAVRPELIIPLLAEDGQPARSTPAEPLSLGALVRVVRQPYFGMTGHVVEMPSLARRVESGVRLHLARVEIEQVGRVSVPVLNLELIR
jgi:hypothetical protein